MNWKRINVVLIRRRAEVDQITDMLINRLDGITLTDR